MNQPINKPDGMVYLKCEVIASEKGTEPIDIKGSEPLRLPAMGLGSPGKVQCINSLLNEKFAHLDKHNSKLRQIKVWRYLDFLYFSIIIQSTTGYGDILPNHGWIRVCVSAQILLAIIIVVIVINSILLEKSFATKNNQSILYGGGIQKPDNVISSKSAKIERS